MSGFNPSGISAGRKGRARSHSLRVIVAARSDGCSIGPAVSLGGPQPNYQPLSTSGLRLWTVADAHLCAANIA